MISSTDNFDILALEANSSIFFQDEVLIMAANTPSFLALIYRSWQPNKNRDEPKLSHLNHDVTQQKSN